jgi:hypothetical protein
MEKSMPKPAAKPSKADEMVKAVTDGFDAYSGSLANLIASYQGKKPVPGKMVDWMDKLTQYGKARETKDVAAQNALLEHFRKGSDEVELIQACGEIYTESFKTQQQLQREKEDAVKSAKEYQSKYDKIVDQTVRKAQDQLDAMAKLQNLTNTKERLDLKRPASDQVTIAADVTGRLAGAHNPEAAVEPAAKQPKTQKTAEMRTEVQKPVPQNTLPWEDIFS